MLRLYNAMIASIMPAVLAFREKQDGNKPVTIKEKETEDATWDEPTDDDDHWLVCRQCSQKITKPTARISINGSHRHTFANPSGIVFEIGCFSQVRGCNSFGSPSAEFAWFPGSTWQIAVCSKCLTHLGWFFSSGNSPGFIGLILDRLSETTSKNN